MLGAPETASGKIYLLQILFFHIYPFYVFFILEIVVDYLLTEWCQCQPHQSEVHHAPRNADDGDAQEQSKAKMSQGNPEATDEEPKNVDCRLPHSRLGHSSKLDGSRCSFGS